MASALVVGSVASGAGVSAEALTGSVEDVTITSPLRVGSFNIRGIHHDPKARGAQKTWAERRGAVFADILGERPDVLGVQEAHQSYQYADQLKDGQNQYLDLQNGLNKAGGTYRLTNAVPHNCVREWTISKCEYQYRGASRNTRILYNTQTVTVLESGSYRYTVQSGGANDDRYLVWAKFRHHATGQPFLFANTHLVNKDGNKQKAQWQELIAQVEQLKGDMPVVVVGDFQRSRTKFPSNEMMQEMDARGYGDVVGQEPNTLFLSRARTARRVNAWMNSVNGFNRNVADWSFETDRKRKAGNYADWIFASNELPVYKWKVVADVKKVKRKGKKVFRLRGVVPSDHNMVSAVVGLPSVA